VLFYWLAITSFMLQVYFDFSGYSDMAIGLGRVFGFTFLENFNYPFISRSITEFWRRWHISMGTWFREYIYIPLGGNRVSKFKWIRNIVIVWFVTGFWHGAAWNFIVWGMFFGVLLTVEKLFLEKTLNKIPKTLAHFYCMFIITISFVIFHLETLPGIIGHFSGMFGFAGLPAVSSEALFYLDSYKVILIAALIGATPFLKNTVLKLKSHAKASYVIDALNPVFIASLLIVITAYLIDSSFNPFLYFRF
jgi:alginate O-acetyltransferase complex protein AlgI